MLCMVFCITFYQESGASVNYYFYFLGSSVTPDNQSIKTRPSVAPSRRRRIGFRRDRANVKQRKRLLDQYPCKTRTGMSCAVDTAWHKRGFDSLTCKCCMNH